MPATVSPYSISVGQRLRGGFRTVALNHRGRPVFRAEHREVQWVTLASFSAPGEKPVMPEAHDLLHESVFPYSMNGLDATTATGAAAWAQRSSVPGASDTRWPQEYLCVFHREEHKDRLDRYVVVQPTVLCSAYAVRDGTSTTFALHDLSLQAITAGRVGVFLHGGRSGSRSYGSLTAPRAITFNGAYHRALADTWWMASPLVVKPVYLKVLDAPDDAALRGKNQGGMRSSSMGPAAAATTAARAPGVAVGGRVPRSRSGTPAAAVPYSQSLEPGSSYAPATTAGPLCLNAQVVFQFAPVGDTCSAAADSATFVLLRTGAEELGLARTRIAHHLDAMTMEWMPHRVEIPGLSAHTASLSGTVSEHALFAQETALLLYDSLQSRVHIIRLRGLLDAGGSPQKAEDPSWGMDLLFSLSHADFPIVLPCLRRGAPQPLLVTNYPRDNMLTLLSPLRLVKSVPGDSVEACVIASMPLSNQLEGYVDGRSEHPSTRTTTSLAWDLSTEAATMASGGAQAPMTLPAHILAVAYQDRHTLCLLYRPSWGGESGDGVHGGSAPPGRRIVVEFPCLQDGGGPLLMDVLDTLAAAIGQRHVFLLEERLLQCAWAVEAGKLAGDAQAGFDFTSACLRILEHSVRAAHGVAGVCAATHGAAPRTSLARCLAAVVDPLALTADAISNLCAALTVGEGGAPVGRTGLASEPEVSLSLEQSALCIVGLHLLCESYKLQERMWPLLSRLCVQVRAMAEAIGWESYAQYYAACGVATSTAVVGSSSPEWNRASPQLPPQVLHKYFSFASEERSESGGVEEDRWAAPALGPGGVTALSDAQLAATPVGQGCPPDVYRTLTDALRPSDCGPSPLDAWPMLRGLPCGHPIELANRVVRMYAALAPPPRCASRRPASALAEREGRPSARDSPSAPSTPWWLQVCQATARGSLCAAVVRDGLCVGVAAPLQLALLLGGDAVASEGGDAFAAAVGRLDHVQGPVVRSILSDPGRDVVRRAEERAVARPYDAALTGDDGVMVRRDFPHVWRDSRLDAAQVYFNTSRPVHLPSGAGQPADALKTLALRVCALPIGRGMLTMATHTFRVRDSIPIPRLDLDGRTADGVFVANTAKDMQSDALLWPLFHNGCAAGLRFLPLGSAGTCVGAVASPGPAAEAAGTAPAAGAADAGDGQGKESVITRHWVVYQTKNARSPAARAGLLLAAGLLGHLRVLQLTDIYALLVSPRVPYHAREATTMAVMLGLSCSFRGANNDLVFRCLSMHVQSLTPSAEEIDVTLDVQTCALVAIGLLCQRTPTNSFLVEVFLGEMARLPSDEHCTNREGYALGAGFGLGLLLLGIGRMHGLANVEERLFAFLEGGRRDAVPHTAESRLDSFEERTCDVAGNFLTRALLMKTRHSSSRTACTRVYEGDYYNVGISGPAAAVALGLMYLKTDDAAIAAKLRPPSRLSGLQSTSPVLCLLRTLSASLIEWSSITPTLDYVHRACTPSVLQALTLKTGAAHQLMPQQVHYLQMNRGHCIAGAVLAVGLRYAGSMDGAARELILGELKGFLKGYLGSTGIPVSTLQRSTGAYEMCLSACCTAVGLVMAGTGDLSTFALLQRLHARPSTPYGTHVALSMSVGLLFLGGGRLTLSATTDAVAALLLAVYPVWPKGPEDNIHHLQILRHLYGLAVVPRVLEAVDAVSNRPVHVPVRVVLRAGEAWRESGARHAAPSPQTVAACREANGASDENEESDTAGARRRRRRRSSSSGSDGMQGSGTSPQPSTACLNGTGGGRVDGVTPQRYVQERREMLLETPCLYPPPEAIERIDIYSTRHYPRTLRAQDGVIGDHGLLVRVLETGGRDAEGCAIDPHAPLSALDGSSDRHVRNAAERCLLDWVQQLFSHRGMSVVEATVMIDNIRLACGAHRWSSLRGSGGGGPPSLSLRSSRHAPDGHSRGAAESAATAATGDDHDKNSEGWSRMSDVISRDVCRAVERTLERRYRALLAHGSAGTHSGHPLHRILFNGETLAAVAADVLLAPSGTAAFPVDFTELCGGGAVAPAVSSPSRSLLDPHEVERWLVESTHFYFGSGAALARLAEVLRHHRQQLERRPTRSLALLRVNQSVNLPLSVLQQVMRCCFDE